MQMTQPTLSVWYDDSFSEAFLLKTAECVKTGVGYPAFFNQKTYIEHERKTSGLPLALIRKHAAIGGCMEPTLQGLSYGVVQAGFVNHGKLLDLTLSDNELIVQDLAWLAARAPGKIIIRHAMIPGYNDDPENHSALADLILGLGLKRLDLEPYHPLGEPKYEALGLSCNYLPDPRALDETRMKKLVE